MAYILTFYQHGRFTRDVIHSIGKSVFYVSEMFQLRRGPVEQFHRQTLHVKIGATEIACVVTYDLLNLAIYRSIHMPWSTIKRQKATAVHITNDWENNINSALKMCL